jgi:hypothetical protein
MQVLRGILPAEINKMVHDILKLRTYLDQEVRVLDDITLELGVTLTLTKKQERPLRVRHQQYQTLTQQHRNELKAAELVYANAVIRFALEEVQRRKAIPKSKGNTKHDVLLGSAIRESFKLLSTHEPYTIAWTYPQGLYDLMGSPPT